MMSKVTHFNELHLKLSSGLLWKSAQNTDIAAHPETRKAEFTTKYAISYLQCSCITSRLPDVPKEHTTYREGITPPNMNQTPTTK